MRELYSAYGGARAAWASLEVLADNVANAGTTGFRERSVRFEEVLGSVEVRAGGARTSDGNLVQDGVDTHLALRGDGFFALADGTYTRDGRFRLDDTGQLVTAEGVAVLGEGGPVRIVPTEERMTIDADGLVSGTVSGEIGKLRVVSLTGSQSIGGNRWTGTEAGAATVKVVQGALEGSNVDPMRCMVDLVEASRFFEAQQKLIQAADEARSRLNQMQG